MDYQLGHALYDYEAQYQDELTIYEGERLYLFGSQDGEWMRAQPVDREAAEGIVPLTYVQADDSYSWDNDQSQSQAYNQDGFDPSSAAIPSEVYTAPGSDDWGAPPVVVESLPIESPMSTGKKSLFSTFLRKSSSDSNSSPNGSKSRPDTVTGPVVAKEGELADSDAGLRTWYKKYKEPPKDLFSIDFGQGTLQRQSTVYQNGEGRGSSDTSSVSSSPAIVQTPSPAPVPQTPPPPPAFQKFWYDHIVDANERESLLASITKEEKTFQQAAYELLVTERDYLADLKIMSDVYQKPLLEQNILRPHNVEALFSNLEDIIKVNEYFLGELESCRNIQESPTMRGIGDAFVRSAVYFKHYTEFCCNHPNALMMLEKKSKKEQFAKFLKDAQARPECKGLTLPSFLIKPIQRICKYPLLIREMLKNIDESHVECSSLKQAQEEIEAVVSELNEQKRQAEDMERLMQTVAKIKSDEPLEIVTYGRRAVFDGTVIAIEDGKSAGERQLFLFNDMLLLTKPQLLNLGKEKYKLISQIDLASVCVNDGENLPQGISIVETPENLFEVVKIGKKYQKNISMVFDAGDEKGRWITEFERLDVKRNQKLETIPQISSQESQLMMHFKNVETSSIDPMEAYRREHEEIFRRQKEAKLEALRQQEEAERLERIAREEEAKWGAIDPASTPRERPAIKVIQNPSIRPVRPSNRLTFIEQDSGTAAKPKPKPPVPSRNYQGATPATTTGSAPRPPSSAPPRPNSSSLQPPPQRPTSSPSAPRGAALSSGARPGVQKASSTSDVPRKLLVTHSASIEITVPAASPNKTSSAPVSASSSPKPATQATTAAPAKSSPLANSSSPGSGPRPPRPAQPTAQSTAQPKPNPPETSPPATNKPDRPPLPSTRPPASSSRPPLPSTRPPTSTNAPATTAPLKSGPSTGALNSSSAPAPSRVTATAPTVIPPPSSVAAAGTSPGGKPKPVIPERTYTAAKKEVKDDLPKLPARPANLPPATKN